MGRKSLFTVTKTSCGEGMFKEKWNNKTVLTAEVWDRKKKWTLVYLLFNSKECWNCKERIKKMTKNCYASDVSQVEADQYMYELNWHVSSRYWRQRTGMHTGIKREKCVNEGRDKGVK